MTELAESFLLLDGDESFIVAEIEDYEITGPYESPASLSPPIDMNRAGKQVALDFSEAIDANFRKRMNIDENIDVNVITPDSDFTFIQTKDRCSSTARNSLLRKALNPEQLAFQRRLAARKSFKKTNRRAMTAETENSQISYTPELGPFICIW